MHLTGLIEQYYSPSTGETLTVTESRPPVEEQWAWIEAHKDAVHLSPLEAKLRKF